MEKRDAKRKREMKIKKEPVSQLMRKSCGAAARK
jgi:hypothetical protein